MGIKHGRRSADRKMIDPHKHETRADRERRWAESLHGTASRLEQHGQQQHRQFDVLAWDALHREAEEATLFNRRPSNWHTSGHDRDVDNVAHPGHPSNIGDR